MEPNSKMDSDPNAQKRKAHSTSLSLYDSDEEANGPAKKSVMESDIIGEIKGLSSASTHHTNSAATTATKETPTSPQNCVAVANRSTNVHHSVCIERKGEREEMQDRHLMIDSFGNQFGNLLETQKGVGNDRCALYALFDGHAGRRAADYCAEHFAQTFVNVCKKYVPSNSAISIFEKSMKKIFIETYKKIDDGFIGEARKHKPTLKDGTTVTTIFMSDNALYCANIGDSKAIVCRHKPDKKEHIPLQLTVDHNPIVFEERMRIQKTGGTVKDGRVMGILEVSRSIGDGQMKTHGVICTPDIKKLTITQNDIFLVLACDGLWKVFTPEAVLKFVCERYKVHHRKGASEIEISELWTKIADDMNAEAPISQG